MVLLLLLEVILIAVARQVSLVGLQQSRALQMVPKL
jgi:hypothetical protein